MALTQILKYTQDEELTANSLKILRYAIKAEKNHQQTMLEYPDMINDVI